MGIREIQVDVRTSDVMAGREPGERLDPRLTSDTSQKVPCDASVGFSGYILSILSMDTTTECTLVAWW